MKRVIDVTEDGSDFVVVDTRSLAYAKYLLGYALRKMARRMREVINGKTTKRN